MSENSKIEWTTHTFNPWWGCARVSPGCRFCYADGTAQRYGHQVWRRKGPRRMLSDANWKRPLKWNRDAEREGVRARVFCASMADVFEDHPDLAEPRARLWPLIEQTPWLDWQVLTKRPENVAGMVPWGSQWPGHVWLGTSVENQTWAEKRIPILMEIPARVRFLSCEPLLGPVSIRQAIRASGRQYGCGGRHHGSGAPDCPRELHHHHDERCRAPMPDWAIVGGESGPKARPMDLAWAESLVDECIAAGVPVHVKQLGSVWARDYWVNGEPVSKSDPKGGNWDFWPRHRNLHVREFPESRVGVPR